MKPSPARPVAKRAKVEGSGIAATTEILSNVTLALLEIQALVTPLKPVTASVVKRLAIVFPMLNAVNSETAVLFGSKPVLMRTFTSEFENPEIELRSLIL